MKIEKPFIIWTTQRAGGTNLSHRLMQLSVHPKTDHEPFLENRCYGHVTLKWIDHGNMDELMSDIASICSQSILIKHCVGLVPWEISCSLMKVSTSMGYRHVFLHRKSAFDRLLSLYFASQTGIWAQDMESFVRVTGGQELSTDVTFMYDYNDVINKELPIEWLACNEDYCIQSMIRLWWLAKFTEGKVKAVSFEEVYCSDDQNSTKSILINLLNFLCLTVSNPDKWLDKTITQKAQGTRNKYQQFQGVELLKNRLTEVHKFQPKSYALANKNPLHFFKNNSFSPSLRYDVFVDYIKFSSVVKINLLDFLSNTELELNLRMKIITYAVEQMLLTGNEFESILYSESRYEWDLRRSLLYRAIETDIIDCASVAKAALYLLSEIPVSNDDSYLKKYNIASLKELAELNSEAKVDFSKLLLNNNAESIHAGCHFHLGRIALRQDDYRTAQHQMTSCLDKFPEHREARRMLSLLKNHKFL